MTDIRCFARNITAINITGTVHNETDCEWGEKLQ